MSSRVVVEVGLPVQAPSQERDGASTVEAVEERTASIQAAHESRMEKLKQLEGRGTSSSTWDETR